jgi:hypothetical protein
VLNNGRQKHEGRHDPEHDGQNQSARTGTGVDSCDFVSNGLIQTHQYSPENGDCGIMSIHHDHFLHFTVTKTGIKASLCPLCQRSTGYSKSENFLRIADKAHKCKSRGRLKEMAKPESVARPSRPVLRAARDAGRDEQNEVRLRCESQPYFAYKVSGAPCCQQLQRAA